MNRFASVSSCVVVWNAHISSSSSPLISKYKSSPSSASSPPADDSVDNYLGTRCLSWSPSNQLIAVNSCLDASVDLYRSSDCALISTVKLSSASLARAVSSMDFSPSSRYLSLSSDKELYIWDFKRNTFKYHYTGHKAPILASFFIDDTSLLTGDIDGDIRVWRISSEGRHSSIASTSSQRMTSMTSSRALSAAGGHVDGSIRVVDVQTKTILRTHHTSSSSITALSFSPRNPRLIMSATEDRRVYLLDTADKNSSTPSATITTDAYISAISFHDNSVLFAAGTVSGNVHLFDWRFTKTAVCSESRAHDGAVLALSFERTQAVADSRAVELSLVPHEEGVQGKEESSESVGKENGRNSSESDAQSSKAQSREPGNRLRPSGMSSSGVSRSIVRGTQAEPAKSIHHEDTMRSALSADSRMISNRESEAGEVDVDKQEDFALLRKAVRPVTSQELTEALEMLRYDMHREVQAIIHEQVRQFEIAKADNLAIISTLSEQLRELLKTNEELREQNERLRRIY